MKQLCSLLTAVAITITANAELKVTVPPFATFDEIIITSCPLADLATDSRNLRYDTIHTDTERIFSNEVPMCYVVNPAYQDYNSITIYAAPDEDISLIIDNKKLSESTVKGSPLMDSIAEYRRELIKYSTDSISLITDRDDRIMAAYLFNLNYALSHSNEPVSIIPLMHIPVAMASTAIDSIGPDARNGLLAPIYERICKNVAAFHRQREAQKASTPGNPARDFSLTDIDGNNISLSDFRGRWVLLDFWGTWCGWCIKGFPAMREFHNAYGDRCKIIAIDCNDPEERWRDFVTERELPWINLINDPSSSANNAAKLYGIEAFPTKILIDPEGIIRLFIKGEDPAFYPQAISLITAE